MDRKDILITGKSGFIAKALGQELEKKHNVLYTSSSQSEGATLLKLQDIEHFDYSKIETVSTVYMLAGISSPDDCANNVEFCKKINVTATSKFIAECLRRKMKVIFASSDVIYGQQLNSVSEKNSGDPIGFYGSYKKEIEEKFKTDDNFKSTRFSYVYSESDKFTKYLKNCCDNGLQAEVFHPLERSVICLNDVIDALSLLPSRWKDLNTPFINFCGNELISRVNIAEILKEYCMPNLDYKVLTPPSSFYLARPKTIHMRSLFLENLLTRKPLSLKQMIIETEEKQRII